MELIANNNNIVIVTPQRINDLVDSFINSQDVKQSSKLLYRRTLKQYFNWVDKKNYLLSEIARPQLLEYKEELLNSNMSSLTVGSYITSVRRFYEWTEANKFYPNVAKGIKSPKRKQQFKKQPLLPAQATDLLNYYENKDSRDYSIINLLSLEIYLKQRGKVNNTDPLFISTSNNNKGERLTTRTISYIAKEGLKAIGLDERSFTAHSLRHTTAVNILRAGGSLETAQFTLRHSNPATTQIYTSTLNEERRLENSGEALIDNLY